MLMTRPKLQTDISEISLQFHIPEIVFTAEIKQTYRQILAENYQRIEWRNSQDQPLRDYRLHAVTFPKTADILQADVYVEDDVTGAGKVTEAIALQKELIALMQAGAFQLGSFPEVLAWLSPQELQPSQLLSFDKDNPSVTKVLGLQWSTTLRLLFISYGAHKHWSKKEIARIFDPLGWLTSVLLFSETLMISGTSWNDELLPDILHKWKIFKQDLPLLSYLQLPHSIHEVLQTDNELHAFCNRSVVGYPAVVYLRSVYPDGGVKVMLLKRKSRVALSDFNMVLHWVASSHHRWKTFVVNPMCQIPELILMHDALQQW
ncbi:hypothetical protein PR048_012548 [Dryococelus australis]|uniref:Uncharacterized protein n=1 Tax=Dryococelus australis TaxID=614101 RepID=A0ABQ9HPN5_9NEOP|nr:hypothetical protein PR048_012548 [Dryococelus australis]